MIIAKVGFLWQFKLLNVIKQDAGDPLHWESFLRELQQNGVQNKTHWANMPFFCAVFPPEGLETPRIHPT